MSYSVETILPFDKNEIIYFLAMYDKSRQTTISDDEILDLLSYIE